MMNLKYVKRMCALRYVKVQAGIDMHSVQGWRLHNDVDTRWLTAPARATGEQTGKRKDVQYGGSDLLLPAFMQRDFRCLAVFLSKRIPVDQPVHPSAGPGPLPCLPGPLHYPQDKAHRAHVLRHDYGDNPVPRQD